MVKIIVAEHDGFGDGAFGPADDAVMGEFVDEQRVPRSKQMGDRRHIGEIAADEGQGRVGAEKLREPFFQKMMHRPLAADEAGGEGAGAEGRERGRGRALHRGMRGKPEIIIIGETGEAATAGGGLVAQTVDGREKRVAALQIGFAGEAKATRRMIFKAVDLCHLSLFSKLFKKGPKRASVSTARDRTDPENGNRALAS